MSLIENSKTALEHIEQITTARAKHLEIWHCVFTAQFVRALELGKDKRFGAKTIEGLVSFLLREYETVNVRRNPKKAIRKVKECFRELIERAEKGEPVRTQLDPLRKELGLLDIEDEIIEKTVEPNRKERRIKNKIDKEQEGIKKRAAKNPAFEPPTHTREAVYVLAKDPTKRNTALEDRARRLREEYPPPEIIEKDKLYKANQETLNLKADWMNWIDGIARRWIGPLDLKDVMRITQAPQYFAQFILYEYRAQLSRGLSEEDKRSSALALCSEAEAIGREALILAEKSSDEKTKLTALKLGLDAIQRRTSLLGLDTLDLNLRVEKVETTWSERAEKLGLTAQDLVKIGDIASKSISKKPT